MNNQKQTSFTVSKIYKSRKLFMVLRFLSITKIFRTGMLSFKWRTSWVKKEILVTTSLKMLVEARTSFSKSSFKIRMIGFWERIYSQLERVVPKECLTPFQARTYGYPKKSSERTCVFLKRTKTILNPSTKLELEKSVLFNSSSQFRIFLKPNALRSFFKKT